MADRVEGRKLYVVRRRLFGEQMSPLFGDARMEGAFTSREAAEEFEISASTAIIWVKCFRETGRCAASWSCAFQFQGKS